MARLHHGVITKDQFEESMLRMAGVVDSQNEADPSYEPMVADGEPRGNAFRAALALVGSGVREPSGYTEPGLHASRLSHKSKI